MSNRFLRKLSSGIGTTATQVGAYTVAVNTQVTIIGLTVANTTSSFITVDVSIKSGSTYYYIIKNAPVANGGSLILVGGDQKIVLEPADSIYVKSSVASSADCVMSILEIY